MPSATNDEEARALCAVAKRLCETKGITIIAGVCHPR